MTIYELMTKTDSYLREGGTLTDTQARHIVKRFLADICTPEQARRYYESMRAPGNHGGMYPLFFLPPYNDGKKFPTVTGQKPQTHILSANAYELEILRLLHILAPEDETVRGMVAQTLARLRKTCFGGGACVMGECFDAALVALRFLACAAPGETAWLLRLAGKYTAHAGDKRRVKASQAYYDLCVSELPSAVKTAVAG